MTSTLASSLLFLLILYFKLAQKSIENTRKLPPGPPRWPIFGNLLQLGPLPHKDFATFCKKYGPLVYLRLGCVDAITTDDPEIIREILFRQDEIFASRPRTLAGVHLAYGCGDVALAPLGPHWKRMRRICMEHLLTTKRLESFAVHRALEAQHLVWDVWTQSQTGKPVNLREVLGAFSMNNVTRMLLGKQYFGIKSAGPEEALEFMHITHELFWLLGLIYLGDYLPIWRQIDPFGCERKMREVEKRVDEFHMKIIEEHRKGSERKKKEDREMDFVDILLSLPGEQGKKNMDDVEIKALIQKKMKGELMICVMLVVVMIQTMVKSGETGVNCGQIQTNLSKCVPYNSDELEQMCPIYYPSGASAGSGLLLWGEENQGDGANKRAASSSM
ncbi:hypothetical protein NE237_001313 [Protea cynaroides]|uniref:Cytochrome P450 n=1 Tax=Protea cynaroides TaxID=273540 RepID=A0A9Q0KSV0_9MAGN|nr:hypothetical protein NE237_001313 [Protea cynaroides]